jgi:hypothetical protein
MKQISILIKSKIRMHFKRITKETLMTDFFYIVKNKLKRNHLTQYLNYKNIMCLPTWILIVGMIE